MSEPRAVLVVDRDPDYGRALVKLLRSQGNDVRLVTSRSQALRATERRRYDVAIVDVLVEGGGTELAHQLSRRVPRLMLSVGAQLDARELLETALGFPVHHKASLPGLFRPPLSNGNGHGRGVEGRAVDAPPARVAARSRRRLARPRR